jgi:hypothetical protein
MPVRRAFDLSGRCSISDAGVDGQVVDALLAVLSMTCQEVIFR